VAIIDIDHFALYNRSLGSIKGNEALEKIAAIIKENTSHEDFCARYGGDVFTVIFESISIEEAFEALENIRHSIEKEFNGKLTISAGFASYPDNGNNHMDLMNNLQHSLHHAKISGKNRIQHLEMNVSELAEKKPVILLVDDSPLSIKMIKKLLSSLKYTILQAESGDEAIEIAEKAEIDLILLDIMMPGKNGYEVCRILKERKKTAHIPVIMVTSLNDAESKKKSLKAGADDFITKPYEKTEIFARTKSLIKLRKLNKKLSNAESTVMSLANLVEGQNTPGKGNIPEIAKLSAQIAKKLGLKGEKVEAVRVAGILHDIGKARIPKKILNKKQPLNRNEWEIVRRHPDLGYNAMQPLKGIYPSSLNAIRYHHEKLDGSGYPKGLKDNEIPLTARIVAVVDMYDALISKRPYRNPKTKKEALSILRKEAEQGKIDRKVVKCLEDILNKKPID